MAGAKTRRSGDRWRKLGLAGGLSLLLAQFALSAPAPAQVSGPLLYGAEAQCEPDSTDLYTINPANGARIGTIGDIGFGVTGLAVDPTTGQLYGTTETCDPLAAGALITINKTTGQGALVGYHFPDGVEAVQDITFTTTGQLFGWTKNGASGDVLVSINKATGLATEVGPTGYPGSFGNGLAADPDDNTLWLTPDSGNGDYGTVNSSTGVFTSQGTLDGTGGFSDAINALAWSCDGETLYASIRDGFFATINTATDHLTEVGRSFSSQDAIAWDCNPGQNPQQPPQPVKCKGQAATLVGTNGNDVLTGTSGKDVIAGRGGNDRISAKGGNDVVCSGGGKDRANGGGGKDTLRGQAANDRLRGAAGNDNLRGGGGRDRCNGGAGTDTGNCEVESSIP